MVISGSATSSNARAAAVEALNATTGAKRRGDVVVDVQSSYLYPQCIKVRNSFSYL